MSIAAAPCREMSTLDADGLHRLLDLLRARGYRLAGPTVRDGAITYDELMGADDLPVGWTDHQEAGHYALRPGPEGMYFGYALGAQSWKRFLHPPNVRLLTAGRACEDLHIAGAPGPAERWALIGVRACDLAAISAMDRVFLEGEHVEPLYAARRDGAFIVAVNCTHAGGTCFCTSMGTGPTVAAGHDLVLTELAEGRRRGFTVEAGSPRGTELLRELGAEPAPPETEKKARQACEKAAAQISRKLETAGLREVLARTLDSPRWEEIGSRCLTCGNCTMVCPTCFCTTVEDSTDLADRRAERWRRWDSCFTLEFSYLFGGSVRYSAGARYRQWLTHKLAFWHDQFGGSGCVGCGRCVTWCPVGIDLTEEVKALRDGAMRAKEGPNEDAGARPGSTPPL